MIGVMGAGAFGTALAIALSTKGTPVTLWARSDQRASDMAKFRCNRAYLPDAQFPEDLSVTANIAEFSGSHIILLAVPLQQLRSAAVAIPKTSAPLVACCKGIELDTGLGPTGVLRDVRPDANTAVLTGPSFAADIAVGRPTALTLACTDDALGEFLQTQLTTSSLRLYRTTDTVGAELGGALKNVIAIACGAAIGAGLGESARAATMTRGFAEMQRIAALFGAQPETLMGLSGLGDLALTCASEQSRNFRLGLSLGRNEFFDPKITVEGAATARAMTKIAKDRQLDTPLITTVTALLDGTTNIADAISELMTRPLKEE